MKYIDKHAYFRCLELSVSESCNYQCRYCIFWRNNRRRALMSQELALAVTDKYLDYLEYHAQNIRQPLIYFGTGEPLLSWPTINTVSRHVRRRMPSLRLSLITNGSLVTPEILRSAKDLCIDVGLSIDGERKTQNLNRPMQQSGRPIDTYQAVIDALELGRSIDFPFYSLSATYNRPGFTQDALHVLSLCEKYSIREFALDYDISSLTPENYQDVAEELLSLYAIAREKQIGVFGYWLIPYLNQKEGDGFHCYCGNSAANSICITPDGEIKVCGYDPRSFGMLSDFESILQNPEYRAYLQHYNDGSEDCQGCELYTLCCGQCIFGDRSQEAWQVNCRFMKYLMEKLREGDESNAEGKAFPQAGDPLHDE